MIYTDYLTIGLFVCGAALITVSAILLLRKDSSFAKTTLSIVFSVLLLGLSVFGMPFLTAYGDWLKIIKPLLTQDASPQLYASTLGEVAKGDLDPAVSAVAVQTMMARPIPDMDKLVDETIAKNPDAPGSLEIKAMKQQLDIRKRQVDDIAGGIAERTSQGDVSAAGSIEQLDEATRIEVARELARRRQVMQQVDRPTRELIERRTRLQPLSRRVP